MVKYMLKFKQLHKEFWTEAIANAWTKRRPLVCHPNFQLYCLRACVIAYVHVLDQLKKKMDSKYEKYLVQGLYIYVQ